MAPVTFVSVYGEVGFAGPMFANAPKVPHVSVMALYAALARSSWAVAMLSPDPASDPAENVTGTDVVFANAGTLIEPRAGVVTSGLSVSVVWTVFPAASAPVTATVGELAVFAAHENVPDTNGPPAGVVCTSGVACVHPVDEPPKAPNVADAGPEPPSAI